jgi:hypothetical protein
MELSPSWEAANCGAIPEIPNISWNPKVHNHAHKSSPLVPNPEPDRTTPPYLSKIHFDIVHLRLGFPSGLFLSGFLTSILYALLFSLFNKCGKELAHKFYPHYSKNLLYPDAPAGDTRVVISRVLTLRWFLLHCVLAEGRVDSVSPWMVLFGEL